MKTDIDKKALSVVIGGLGVVAALMFAAPASAEPVIPVPPPAPADPAVPAPADPAVPAPTPQDTTVQAAAGLPTPPEEVPHLSSPENLPPGTTDTPVDQGQPRSLGYLRDLWHAVQTQEVSGKDALLLLSQRPMSPDAAPPPGMPANPTPPLPPDVAPTP